MPLTPEEARALLNVRHPEEDDTGSEEEAWLWMAVKAQLTGRPWRGHMDEKSQQHEEYQRQAERSRRVCDLNLRCRTNPEDTRAHEERDTLIEEMVTEAEAELDELLEQIENGQRKDLWHP